MILVPDPGTGVYEQLLAALNDKVPKDQGTENAGKVLGVGDDGLVRPRRGGSEAGGTADHSQLINRDKADQHPISAITGLEDALEGKQAEGDYITADSLQDATDAALARPRRPARLTARGDRKATPGAQGDRGPQGERGPAGAGMDITGAAVGRSLLLRRWTRMASPQRGARRTCPGGTDLNAVQVYVADFAHDEMTVSAGAVDKYARVVVS